MNRWFLISVLISLLAALLLPQVANAMSSPRELGENLVEVDVVGKGLTEDEALRDAHRKAVERAAGANIFSESETRDFALVRDTILARATGYVQKTVILDKSESGGIVTLEVRATVSIKGIEDTWGVVTNLLQRTGRPKVMVFIDEKIGDRRVENSTLQTRIENRLLQSGFLLVNRNQLGEIDRRKMQQAITENEPRVAQAIAQRFGAQLFISGTAHATAGEHRRIGGVQFYRYEAEANIRCYRSDTAQLLSAIPGQSTAGVQRVWRSAAKQALDNQAKQIAPKVQLNILRFWQDALEGRGEVVLEISGVEEYLQYSKLKRELKKIDGIGRISAEYSKPLVKISIESGARAESIADRIAIKFEDVIEITGLSQNVIKAKYIKAN